MFRKAYITATVVLMLFVMSAAFTGCPQDVRAQYQVTIQNLTPLQAFEPVLAVTHSADVFVFREVEAASADFVDFVEDADLGLVDVLDNLDAVTDIYLLEDGLSVPLTVGDTATFTLMGEPDDLLTVVARPEVVLVEDPFGGLDSVPLPVIGARTFYLNTYEFDNGEVDAVLDLGLLSLVRVTVTRVD